MRSLSLAALLYGASLAALTVCGVAERKHRDEPPPACLSSIGSDTLAWERWHDGSLSVIGSIGGLRVLRDGRLGPLRDDEFEYLDVFSRRHRSVRDGATARVRRGDRIVVVRAHADEHRNVLVRIDDGPIRHVATRRPPPFAFHSCNRHSQYAPGEHEFLLPFDRGWLFVAPDVVVTFDDHGRRLDGCAALTNPERLSSMMPAWLASIVPATMPIAIALGALGPLWWLIALAVPRRRAQLVTMHAIAFAIASLLALTMFGLPLLI